MNEHATTVPEGRRRPGRPTLSDGELLDTALDVFLANGFERTSMEAICNAAGMAKRTVYARFENKKNLFHAALARAIDEWIVPIERLRAIECEDDEQTLLEIGRLLVANVLSPAGLRLLRLTNAESVHMPEISIFSVKRGTEPTLAYLSELFRERFGIADSATPNPEEMAQAFLSLVVGGVSSNAAWGMDIADEAIDRHTRNSVSMFIRELSLRRGGVRDDDDYQHLKQLLATASNRIEQVSSDLNEAKAIIATLMRQDGRRAHGYSTEVMGSKRNVQDRKQ